MYVAGLNRGPPAGRTGHTRDKDMRAVIITAAIIVLLATTCAIALTAGRAIFTGMDYTGDTPAISASWEG